MKPQKDLVAGFDVNSFMGVVVTLIHYGARKCNRLL